MQFHEKIPVTWNNSGYNLFDKPGYHISAVRNPLNYLNYKNLFLHLFFTVARENRPWTDFQTVICNPLLDFLKNSLVTFKTFR